MSFYCISFSGPILKYSVQNVKSSCKIHPCGLEPSKIRAIKIFPSLSMMTYYSKSLKTT